MKHQMLRIVIMLIFGTIVSLTLTAHGDMSKELRGEVFSDPSKKQKMPEPWIRQPVVHPREAGNADLFIVMDYDGLLVFFEQGEQANGQA